MSTAAILKGLISRISFPEAERPSCWGVIKIEKMLKELNINDYEIINEPRIVNVGSSEDLMRILLHLVPHEVSNDYYLTLSKLNDKVRLKIGCWQFEASA